MAVLWKCPNCGKGKRAASRLRKNASDRFCLDCSAKSPTLVERVAPRLEKKREASKTRSKAKAAKKRERAVARYMVGGVDMVASFARAKRLRCWKRWKVDRYVERLGMNFVRRKDGETSGRHWNGRGSIHISAGVDPFDVEKTIVHEIVHEAHARRGLQRVAGRKTRACHDAEFHDMLRVAACEYFGFPGEKVSLAYQHAGGAARAYSMDDALRAVRRELDPAGARAGDEAKAAAAKAKRASSRPWKIEREGDRWLVEIPGVLHEAGGLDMLEEIEEDVGVEVLGASRAGRGWRYSFRCTIAGLVEISERMGYAWESPHRAAAYRLCDDLTTVAREARKSAAA